MNLPTTLDLKSSRLHIPTALEYVITEKTKKLTLVTWSFGLTAVEELNALVKRGVKVQVVAGNIQLDGEPLSICKFPVISNKRCHCKIWVVDKEIYVGSTNLVSDTILNLMIRLQKNQAKSVLILVQDLIDGLAPTNTLIIE